MKTLIESIHEIKAKNVERDSVFVTNRFVFSIIDHFILKFVSDNIMFSNAKQEGFNRLTDKTLECQTALVSLQNN